MKATGKAQRWTYEEYLLLPADGKRHEITDGERHVTPAPAPRHQAILAYLLRRIAEFAETHDLGTCLPAPVDLVLAEDTVVQPDLLFIQKDRLQIIGKDAVTAAPDLVIEILSASSRKLDYVIKFKLYAAHGVSEYWIVDPDAERIEVFVLESSQFVKKSEVTAGEVESPVVLKNLRIPVAEIFR